MKYCVATIFAICTLARAATAPSQQQIAPPVEQGESAADYLRRLFADDDHETLPTEVAPASETPSVPTTQPTSKRARRRKERRRSGAIFESDDYTRHQKRFFYHATGLYESIWLDDEDTYYNITADMSNCATGIKPQTVVGTYSTTDGRTITNATFSEIVQDIYTLQRPYAKAIRARKPNMKYANHTLANAQLLLAEASDLLNERGMICTTDKKIPNSKTPDNDINLNRASFSQELRHLLADAPSTKSAWAVILGAPFLGGGLGAAIAAANDAIFHTHINTGNVVQTAEVVGIIGLITGIAFRMHEVGRIDRAAIRARAAAARARPILFNSAVAAVANVQQGGRTLAQVGRNAMGSAGNLVGLAAEAGQSVNRGVQRATEVAARTVVPGGAECGVLNVVISWGRAVIASIRKCGSACIGALTPMGEAALDQAVEEFSEAISEAVANAANSGAGQSASGGRSTTGALSSCMDWDDAASAVNHLGDINAQELGLVPFRELTEQVGGPSAILQGSPSLQGCLVENTGP